MSHMEKLIAEIRSNKEDRAHLEARLKDLQDQQVELHEQLKTAGARHRVLRETLDDHVYNGTDILVAKMRAHETVEEQQNIVLNGSRIISGSISASKISANSITANQITRSIGPSGQLTLTV